MARVATELAKELSGFGGGHPEAAGAEIPNQRSDLKFKIISKIKEVG